MPDKIIRLGQPAGYTFIDPVLNAAVFCVQNLFLRRTQLS